MFSLAKKPFSQDEVIATYKRLIRSMPRANQYLLLYVLDLLSVFARKSDKNLMTAKSAYISTSGVLTQLTPIAYGRFGGDFPPGAHRSPKP